VGWLVLAGAWKSAHNGSRYWLPARPAESSAARRKVLAEDVLDGSSERKHHRSVLPPSSWPELFTADNGWPCLIRAQVNLTSLRRAWSGQESSVAC
jgi:hypothetical protein